MEASLSLGLQPQCELKSCAGTVIGHDPQSPAVILNDRAADRQPHFHALRFGDVESVKYLFEVLRIDPIPESRTPTSS